ncbi:MAG: hypothetical protein GEU78_13970 [Actinobacteria bacterium]|nr:hypothetical protein [Actinomycetota bacterium]
MEFTPTDRQRRLIDLARSFRENVIVPLSPHEREWEKDPDRRFPWEAVVEGSKNGLRILAVPERFGGGGTTILDRVLVLEELAVGDAGVASIFDQAYKFTEAILEQGTEEQQRWIFEAFLADERFLLAGTFTEPDRGTDNSLRYGRFATRADLEGDEWVLNGQKRYISCGGEASLYLVGATVDPDKSMAEGSAMFIVPRDTPGLTIEKQWEKVGFRLMNNASIAFTGVRVPRENVLGGEIGISPDGPIHGSPSTPIGIAAQAIGTARAALQAAIQHAHERIQTGRPIIEHQAIGFALVDHLGRIEAARALMWRAAHALDTNRPDAVRLAAMAKVVAAEACSDACRQSMEVLGGAGVMMESPLQKYARDSLTFFHPPTQEAFKAAVQRGLLQDMDIQPFPA